MLICVSYGVFVSDIITNNELTVGELKLYYCMVYMSYEHCSFSISHCSCPYYFIPLSRVHGPYVVNLIRKRLLNLRTKTRI